MAFFYNAFELNVYSSKLVCKADLFQFTSSVKDQFVSARRQKQSTLCQGETYSYISDFNKLVKPAEKRRQRV